MRQPNHSINDRHRYYVEHWMQAGSALFAFAHLKQLFCNKADVAIKPYILGFDGEQAIGKLGANVNIPEDSRDYKERPDPTVEP